MNDSCFCFPFAWLRQTRSWLWPTARTVFSISQAQQEVRRTSADHKDSRNSFPFYKALACHCYIWGNVLRNICERRRCGAPVTALSMYQGCVPQSSSCLSQPRKRDTEARIILWYTLKSHQFQLSHGSYWKNRPIFSRWMVSTCWAHMSIVVLRIWGR